MVSLASHLYWLNIALPKSNLTFLLVCLQNWVMSFTNWSWCINLVVLLQTKLLLTCAPFTVTSLWLLILQVVANQHLLTSDYCCFCMFISNSACVSSPLLLCFFDSNVAASDLSCLASASLGKFSYRFYHVKDASQVPQWRKPFYFIIWYSWLHVTPIHWHPKSPFAMVVLLLFLGASHISRPSDYVRVWILFLWEDN